MSGQAQIDWQNDPGFQQLPLVEKHKALLAIDAGYKALPPQEQSKALNVIQYGAKGTSFEQQQLAEVEKRTGAPQGFEEHFRAASGLQPKGGFSDDITQLGQAATGAGSHPIDTLKQIVSMLFSGQQNLNEEAVARMKQPGIDNKLTGATQWLESGVPGFGPMINTAANSLKNEGMGAAAGDLMPILGGKALEEGASATSALASRVKSGTVPALQKTLGVGPDFTEQAVKDWQGKAGEVSEANRQALTRARGEHEGKVADIEEENRIGRESALRDFQAKDVAARQQNVQALSKARQGETDFQLKVEAAKQANEQAKTDFQQRQQLTDEAKGHAQELANKLPQLRDQAKADAKAMYPEIDGTADAGDLAAKLQNAVDSNLRGAGKTPAVLDRVIKAVAPEDLLSQASVFKGAGSGGRTPAGTVGIDDLPPAARAKFMQQMAKDPERYGYEGKTGGGPTSTDFQTLHDHFSDLGAELSRDLAPDERAAITSARDVLRQEMRKLADADGKLPQFQAAQANWKQYERTFNKTWSDKDGLASPVAKALNAKDSVSGQIVPENLSTILSKDNNYKLAQQMLQRYKGAPTDTLQMMKEKIDQASGLPGKLKQGEVPERSFAPVSLKSPPEMGEVPQKGMPDYQSISLKSPPAEPDIQGMKAEALRKKAEMLGGFSGRGMFIDAAAVVHTLTTGNPLALSIPIGRRLLAKAIKSGSKGTLISLTPEETALLKTAQQSAGPKNIPSSKIFATKEAAAAANLKGNPTPFGGGESELDQATRRAPVGRPKPLDTLLEERRSAEKATAEAKRQAWEKAQEAKRKGDKN